jgi:hypothetical protein
MKVHVAEAIYKSMRTINEKPGYAGCPIIH